MLKRQMVRALFAIGIVSLATLTQAREAEEIETLEKVISECQLSIVETQNLKINEVFKHGGRSQLCDIEFNDKWHFSAGGAELGCLYNHVRWITMITMRSVFLARTKILTSGVSRGRPMYCWRVES